MQKKYSETPRFISADLDGWPRSDANYILITEIILMTLFLTLNASDTLLQERNYGHYAVHPTGNFWLSQWVQPMLSGLSDHQLLLLERGCWWMHITGIFVFLNYLLIPNTCTSCLHFRMLIMHAYGQKGECAI